MAQSQEEITKDIVLALISKMNEGSINHISFEKSVEQAGEAYTKILNYVRSAYNKN